MNNLDLSAVFNPVLGTFGLILAGVLTLLANRAIGALQARNLLHLTDQQRAAVLGAVQTGAGMLTADLARGVLPLAEVRVRSPQVLSIAQQALAAVPVASAALGLTEADASAMVVGAVGRMIAADPTIPTVPVITQTGSVASDQSGATASEVSTSTTIIAPAGAAIQAALTAQT